MLNKMMNTIVVAFFFLSLSACGEPLATPSSVTNCDTELSRNMTSFPILLTLNVRLLNDGTYSIPPMLGHDGYITGVAGDVFAIETMIDCQDENIWSQTVYVNDELYSTTNNVVGRTCGNLTISIELEFGLEVIEFCSN